MMIAITQLNTNFLKMNLKIFNSIFFDYIFFMCLSIISHFINVDSSNNNDVMKNQIDVRVEQIKILYNCNND